MNMFIKFWNKTSLIVKIVIGLLIGTVLGLFCPKLTPVAYLGSIFTGALKGIAPVLVLILVSASLINANENIGSRFRTVIVLYLGTTFLGSAVAVCASFIFPLTVQLPASTAQLSSPSGLFDVIKNLLLSIIENPVKAIAGGNFIGILFWSVMLGLTLKKRAGDGLKNSIRELADAVNDIVRIIIQFAPFGVLGLVFEAVSQNGLSIFYDYGKLILLLVGTMLFVALVVNPFIVALALRKNPYPLVFRCIRESAVTAFFTRSSAANIPANMKLCEDLGLDKNIYSVSIPLGATINMDGAAVVITIMSLVCARTLGIEVSFPVAMLVSLVGTLGACGSSGVAGGSLLLIPLACSVLGIPNEASMQMVSVGFIINVIQDSFETALNSSGRSSYSNSRIQRMEKTGQRNSAGVNGESAHLLNQNGNWRVTFYFEGQDAILVDYQDYH